MKKIFILFFLLIISSSAVYSAPGYDPNYTIVIYDDTPNKKLYKKLRQDFYKKYPSVEEVDENGNFGLSVTYPMGAFHQEVERPYYLNAKPIEELPQILYQNK